MSFLESNIDLVRGVVLIVLIISFLGLWAWAWSSKRKPAFRDASMLPLEEDDGSVPQSAGSSDRKRIEE